MMAAEEVEMVRRGSGDEGACRLAADGALGPGQGVRAGDEQVVRVAAPLKDTM